MKGKFVVVMKKIICKRSRKSLLMYSIALSTLILWGCWDDDGYKEHVNHHNSIQSVSVDAPDLYENNEKEEGHDYRAEIVEAFEGIEWELPLENQTLSHYKLDNVEDYLEYKLFERRVGGNGQMLSIDFLKPFISDFGDGENSQYLNKMAELASTLRKKNIDTEEKFLESDAYDCFLDIRILFDPYLRGYIDHKMIVLKHVLTYYLGIDQSIVTFIDDYTLKCPDGFNYGYLENYLETYFKHKALTQVFPIEIMGEMSDYTISIVQAKPEVFLESKELELAKFIESYEQDYIFSFIDNIRFYEDKLAEDFIKIHVSDYNDQSVTFSVAGERVGSFVENCVQHYSQGCSDCATHEFIVYAFGNKSFETHQYPDKRLRVHCSPVLDEIEYNGEMVSYKEIPEQAFKQFRIDYSEILDTEFPGVNEKIKHFIPSPLMTLEKVIIDGASMYRKDLINLEDHVTLVLYTKGHQALNSEGELFIEYIVDQYAVMPVVEKTW
jgi:hypothetical protein